MAPRAQPEPPVAPRPRSARGVVRAALALGALAPLALVPHTAHAAHRAGRPPGGPAIPTSKPPTAPAAGGAPYAPGVVVVGYTPSESPTAQAASAHAAGAVDPVDVAEDTRLLTLGRRVTVPEALARLRHTRGVAWAVPDYIAHTAVVGSPGATAAATRTAPAEPAAAGGSGLLEPTVLGAAAGDTAPAEPRAAGDPALVEPTVLGAAAGTPGVTLPAAARTTAAARAAVAGEPFPNDPGLAKAPGGWSKLQWNFAGEFGIHAPEAWSNLIADHAPGGRGVVVAVLDTGVAYANRGRFRRSPDFYRYQFVGGYDFVAHNHFPNDRNGHGTDVAGTIAEATNNARGLTGLAYGVRIMPVRVLDYEGNGNASTIAKGVRFAVNHHAQVINLSLEFPGGITASDIPELISALRYAHRHHVVVVGAAGNEAHASAAYPARARNVIAVGATTEHGCLASYTNYGASLTLVAPGGGPDADLPGDPNCHPAEPPGRDVFQVTFLGTSPQHFGIPGGYEGTSMATPHVAATAALIIASRVLGRHPTPAQIVERLRATARPLGGPSDVRLYGAGLLDAAAATAPGGPGAVTAPGGPGAVTTSSG
ncbi:MAG TPA: S8 family serine peptidase [Solirubrobacteraceae bacterium]|nr:S8 family serine peptidase [Solirubrobacteraceae bacterium]